MKWQFILLLLLVSCGNSEDKKTKVNETNTVLEKEETKTSGSFTTSEIKAESSQSENEEVPIEYSMELPQALDYDDLIPSNFCQTRSLCIKNKFFPIGWSKDGHFAYIKERPPVQVGIIYNFVIIDLVTDKKVVNERWVEEFETLSELWSSQKMKIQQLLQQHDVIPFSKTPQLISLPTKINGERYSTSISEAHDENQHLTRQKLYVKSKSLGKKKIYDYKRKIDAGPFGSFQSKVIGAYQSPYEDRITILKLNDIYVFEGDKELEIEFIGCYLKK